MGFAGGFERCDNIFVPLAVLIKAGIGTGQFGLQRLQVTLLAAQLRPGGAKAFNIFGRALQLLELIAGGLERIGCLAADRFNTAQRGGYFVAQLQQQL